MLNSINLLWIIPLSALCGALLLIGVVMIIVALAVNKISENPEIMYGVDIDD